MIGAVIAMESEAEILRDRFLKEETLNLFGKTVEIGTVFGQKIALVVCGVGKVNAAAGTCAALQAGADVILNFGVAGGLHSDTKVGGVYAINRVVQYDFDLTQLNGGSLGTLDGETENYITLCVPDIGLGVRALGSGDRFNDSPIDHGVLLSLGLDVRDMEGAAIAQVCKYSNVPCVSVKAISDVYGTGSTTEQYQQNLKLAMNNLKLYLSNLFRGLH